MTANKDFVPWSAKNTVSNVMGPGQPFHNEAGQAFSLPSCINAKTEQDIKELEEFVSQIIKHTRQTSLDWIAWFVAEQNKAMEKVVDELHKEGHRKPGESK